MDRRGFCGITGGVIAGLMTAPMAMELDGQNQSVPAKKRNYKIEIEIYEARKDTWCHKKGDKFQYPQDIGKICPWLMSSLNDFIKVLLFGGTLSWKYEGTPYEKVIDPNGITTEYVRCPDPTANLVVKITRTCVNP